MPLEKVVVDGYHDPYALNADGTHNSYFSHDRRKTGGESERLKAICCSLHPGHTPYGSEGNHDPLDDVDRGGFGWTNKTVVNYGLHFDVEVSGGAVYGLVEFVFFHFEIFRVLHGI